VNVYTNGTQIGQKTVHLGHKGDAVYAVDLVRTNGHFTRAMKRLAILICVAACSSKPPATSTVKNGVLAVRRAARLPLRDARLPGNADGGEST